VTNGNTNVAPGTLALRLLKGVGASEGEGVYVDEDVGVGGRGAEADFRFSLWLALGLESKCHWGAPFMEPFNTILLQNITL
jgi:hypothetical protein